MATRSSIRRGSPWLTAALALAVGVALPFLLLSASLPQWMPMTAMLVLLLAFLARGALTGHWLGHTPADWPLLALLLLAPVGMWASPDLGVTLPRSYALAASAALFWVAAAQHNQPWLRHSGWILLLGGLALALAVFSATQFPAKLPWVQIDIDALQTRLRTPFLQWDEFNPNVSGHVMALLLAPALSLAAKGNSRAQRLAALAVSLLLGALLLLSQSRGALLAALIAVAILMVLANWRWLWLWAPLALAGLAAVLILGQGLNLDALAGGSGSINTWEQRQELWGRALYLMQDFPFTGVGLGMPEPVIKLLYPTFLIGPDGAWFHVHNAYLQIGSEMGVPGLIAFLALLLSVGAVLVKQACNAQAGVYQGLALGLLGSWIVFVVHSLVDAPSFSPTISVAFFALLGLMAAVATADRDPERGAERG